MAELRKSRRDVPVYRQNPFWEINEIPIGQKKISVAGGRHVSKDGETVEHSGIHVVRNIEKDQFVKVYTKNIKAIFDLKASAQKILQFLMVQIQNTPNADGVYLHWFEADNYFSNEDLKMSQATFFRGLAELLEKKFIAESHIQNLYWFNPHLFFNGDRMTFINEYRIKTHD